MNEKVTLSIAGQNVVISGDESMKIFNRTIGLNVFVEQNNEADNDVLELVFDQEIDDLPLKTYLSFEINDIEYNFTENDGKIKLSLKYMTGDRQKFIMEQVSPNRFVATSAANQEQIRIALWFSYLCFCAKRNTFSMHASCVVYNGEAVLFLGKSGTGKSTHTKLWYDNFEGAFLLNDDCPIIKIGDEIAVHGSPWSGKVNCYKKECYPLKAIVKLKQAPENKMIKLDKQKAVAAMYPSFQPILNESETLSDYVFEAMSAIISKIPVFHLDCLPNLDAALLSRKMIFGE